LKNPLFDDRLSNRRLDLGASIRLSSPPSAVRSKSAPVLVLHLPNLLICSV